jgi:L-lactate utilization protein LutC
LHGATLCDTRRCCRDWLAVHIKEGSRCILTEDRLLKAMGLDAALEGRRREVLHVKDEQFAPSQANADAHEYAATDVGVTVALAGLADSGAIVVSSSESESRSVSLLSTEHVALLPEGRILPSLLQAAPLLRNLASPDGSSAATLVGGPSKTADIEKVLVTGVHGPAMLTIIVVEDIETAPIHLFEDEMSDLVLRLLPEINLIKDESLRAQVVACWAEAIEFRGWSEELLRSIPFTLLAENVSIPFIDHVRAVALMCVACDEVLDRVHEDRKTPVNRDFLIAGAMLADVGKLLEFEIIDGQAVKSDYGKHLRHPFSGVGLAFKHGLPSEIMHIIATHSKEGAGEKRLPESIIFHHADFIDFELVK